MRLAVDDDGVIQAHHRSSTSPTSAPTRRARRSSTRSCCPGRTRSRGSASRCRWCGPTRWARPPTAARGCSRRPRGRWRSTTPPARSGIDPVELRRREPARRRPTCRSPSPSGNVFQEITPLETLEQALEILDYDAFRKEQAAARAEGRLPRPRHLRLRRADVDGRRHAGHRGRHGAGRVERQGRRVPRHHVARSERRDHDGADRRRHPRRRLRRRHHRAGRHAVDAVRPGHRRQPHRGGRRRRGPGGDARGAREGAGRRRPRDGGGARGPRDRRAAWCRCGARRRSR